MSLFKTIVAFPLAVAAVTDNQCSCSCCETVSVETTYRCGNILAFHPKSHDVFAEVDVHRQCASTCAHDGVEHDNAKFCYDSCYPPQNVVMGALCQDKKPAFYNPKPVHHLAMRRQGLRSGDISDGVREEETGAEAVARAANAAKEADTEAKKAGKSLEQIRATADTVFQQVSAVNLDKETLVELNDEGEQDVKKAKRFLEMATAMARSSAEKAKDSAITAYMTAADEEAKKNGEQEGIATEQKLSEQGQRAASDAMLTYENAMETAQERANEYQARGDELSGQSLKLQQESTVLRSHAKEAQKRDLVVQANQQEAMSERRMQLAEERSAEANQFYEYAQSIMSRLGGYSQAAAQAADHARKLVDPNAVDMGPPLI